MLVRCLVRPKQRGRRLTQTAPGQSAGSNLSNTTPHSSVVASVFVESVEIVECVEIVEIVDIEYGQCCEWRHVIQSDPDSGFIATAVFDEEIVVTISMVDPWVNLLVPRREIQL